MHLIALLWSCTPGPDVETSIVDTGTPPPDTDTDTDTDTDLPDVVLPVAVIDADTTSGPIPFAPVLSAASSTGTALELAWSIDGVDAGSEEVLDHTWLGSGTSVVTLTVTDAAGATDTASVDLEITTAACPIAGATDIPGTIQDAVLDEISGIAVSRANPGVLWVHNDSYAGPTRQLHAIDETGELLGEFTLEGDLGDWEDIAVGTDDNGDPVLFVAAVGNNGLDREWLAVLVVPEPVVPLKGRTDATLSFHEMQVHYPKDPHDCESIMWDPQTGVLFLLTKSGGGTSRLYRMDPPHDESDVTLIKELELDYDTMPGTKATAAAISPLGDQIIVRTYASTALLWRRDASEPFLSAFDTEYCEIELPSEPQGESIDFTLDGGSVLTISEGSYQPLHRTALD